MVGEVGGDAGRKGAVVVDLVIAPVI